jgi:hypothetical protein
VIIDAWMQQLDDQATDLFLHGNAERVFGLTL